MKKLEVGAMGDLGAGLVEAAQLAFGQVDGVPVNRSRVQQPVMVVDVGVILPLRIELSGRAPLRRGSRRYAIAGGTSAYSEH